MFTFECEFHFKGPQRRAEEVWDKLAYFLCVLGRNGQILHHPWEPIERKKCIRMYLVGPAKDSLQARHFNAECRSAFGELQGLLRKRPTFRLLGKHVEEHGDCRCRAPSCYMLITNFLDFNSPVRCGDCYRHVPLYRLPFPWKEKNYQSLGYWMGLYKACNELEIACGFGERFGLSQMCRLKSPLNALGRDLCRVMGRKTRRPFYYYLHGRNYRFMSKCPGCGGDWLSDQVFHHFEYRCDKCKLFSQST